MGSILSVGESKCVRLAQELYEFNPYIDLQLFRSGLNEANLTEFIDGLDLLIDHMDNIALKLRVREEARRCGVTLLMGTGVDLTPMFDVEMPDATIAFGGRVKPEALKALAEDPKDFAEWVRAAIQVFGIENTPAAVLENFVNVRRKRQNFGSQLGITGLAMAAQLAYFVYEIARGNGPRLAAFKRLHIEQPELFEASELQDARDAFAAEFGLDGGAPS